MKKFLALILSVAMIFALVACGSKEGDTPNTDGDTQQTDTGPDVHPAVRRSELCSQRLRR